MKFLGPKGLELGSKLSIPSFNENQCKFTVAERLKIDPKDFFEKCCPEFWCQKWSK